MNEMNEMNDMVEMVEMVEMNDMNEMNEMNEVNEMNEMLLGRSSLPFASRQMPKMPRGSLAFVIRALKPAVCLHGPLLLGH